MAHLRNDGASVLGILKGNHIELVNEIEAKNSKKRIHSERREGVR